MSKRTSAWGRPAVESVRRNAFNREIRETPPRKNAWGRELTEAKTNPWGRPVVETARNAWGREVEPKPKAETIPAPIPTTTAPKPRPSTPQAARAAAVPTVIQESSGDPLAPWSADRLLDLKPGSKIGIVRRGAGGRWEPAYATG